jgi:thiol-disulfide isomerase/thioredoxin
MKEIELKNLAKELESVGGDSLSLVILWNSECSHCKPFLEMVGNVELNFPKYKFYKVHVDDVPLFAPPAIPSVSVFYNGSRFFEGLGVTNQQTFEQCLELWQTEWETNVRKHNGH